jgi:hypothetical protein
VCQDGQITLCEVLGYACAWIHGCHDDIAGVSRAAYIWRHGECYCWDDSRNNWFPSDCTAATNASVCCDPSNTQPSGSDGGDVAAPIDYAVATLSEIRPNRAKSVRGAEVISLSINPPDGASAAALEIALPSGWKVGRISDGGAWDSANGKVKWGPLMDGIARTVTVEVRRPPVTESKSGVRRSALYGLSGTVSFDGVNYPILVR